LRFGLGEARVWMFDDLHGHDCPPLSRKDGGAQGALQERALD
jgi:hypothetical protein